MIGIEETTDSGVRILHVGNVFLDRPIRRVRKEASEDRRGQLRESFCRLMQAVEEKKIQLVLFSGNLVDNAFATNDTVEFLMREFGAHERCHFVIAPGSSDYYFEKSIYRSGRFPRNVHIFTEEILSRFDFDDIGVTVYGWAFLGEEHTFSPLAHKHVVGADRLNIVCGYGNMEGEDAFCAIPSEQLASFGAHYAALSGPKRKHEGFLSLGGTVVSYSGHFESLSFDDTDFGGVNLITALPMEDGARRLVAKRVVMGSYRYAEEIVDVSHLSRESEVTPLIHKRIAERGYNDKTVLRVRLRGSVAPEVAFLSLGTAADYGVYAFISVDETVPTDGTEALLYEMSAKGELYRHLYRAMTEGTPKSCARAARAFRVGYAALCEKDFTRY